MGREIPFLRWAFPFMEERAHRDDDAPAFGAPLAEARALSEADRRLVHDYPQEGPADPDVLRAAVAELLDGHLVNGRSPRFQNQLFSGVAEEGLAGGLLGIFANNTVSTREVAPLPSEIESAVIDWLGRLLPWDQQQAYGTLTPAGSFSNYLAVYLARKRVTQRLGDAVVPHLAAFTSEAAHYSIEKGADLCGIPRSNVFQVATDDADRMRVDALVAAVERAELDGLVPFFLNATVGTTVLGSLDPLPAAAEALADRDVWVHADGAWGALGLLGSERERFRELVAPADSLTWDAHKGLGAAVAMSFLMVRRADDLDVLRPPHGGRYLFHDPDAPRERADLGLRSLYCGKPFHALSLWLLWKAQGESGLRAHVDRARRLALAFRERIAGSELFEPVHDPETWSVCFRPRCATPAEGDALAPRLREAINASGRWMINLCPSTTGRVFRAIFVNPLMTEAHVDELVAYLEACVSAVRAS